MPFVSAKQENLFRMAKSKEGRAKLRRSGHRLPLMKDVNKMLAHGKAGK